MKKAVSTVLAVLLAALFTCFPALAGIVESGDADYQKDVVESKTPVILQFYATWCSVCKKFAPTVEEIANDMDGVVSVVKIDKDKNPAISAKYGISSVPMFFYIENGKTISTVKGAYPKDKLIDKLGLGPDGKLKPFDPAKAVEADDKSYMATVVNAPIPVLLEFYDSRSADAKAVEPTVTKLAAELAGKVKVVLMNRTAGRNTSVLFGVKDTPAFFYLVNGETKGKTTGVRTRAELMEIIKPAAKDAATPDKD